MLTSGPHIRMTMGLHACQYCTCMHIQSDIDQHNTTHSTARMVRQIIEHYVYMHLAFKEFFF